MGKSQTSPFVSIVTVNRNHAEGLRRTLSSVCEQTYRDFEQIVIDGGSTDESASVVDTFREKIGHYHSEPDRGVYHAMNKGVARASGAYVIFLNSGDIFASGDVLAAASAIMKKTPDSDLFYGSTLRKCSDDSVVVREVPEALGVFDLYKFRICHQSVFYKRVLFNELGGYNEAFRIYADIEFNVRCLQSGRRARRLDMAVSFYEGGGMSSRESVSLLSERERLWRTCLGPSVSADYEYFSKLEAEYRRLKSAEDWIVSAKQNSLWRNIALVCQWRWARARARQNKGGCHDG